MTEVRDDLARLSENYSLTLLAGYASYALGIYYSRDARDFEAKTVRPADLVKAEAFLEEALKRPLLPYYRIRNYSTIVQTYVHKQDLGQARVYLGQFQAEFLDEPLAQPLLEEAREPIRE